MGQEVTASPDSQQKCLFSTQDILSPVHGEAGPAEQVDLEEEPKALPAMVLPAHLAGSYLCPSFSSSLGFSC